jgi:hypothetical protein
MMSLIKSLQDFLKTYDNMELREIQRLMTDTPLKDASSYAIAPTGNSKIVVDIVGNKTYQNNYVFYAKEAAADEVDRQDNYDFLEDFSDWIEEQNDNGNFPELPAKYEVEELEVSNIMLFDIEEDGTGIYQVQIQMIFTKMKG